jgi:hypothetical protein
MKVGVAMITVSIKQLVAALNGAATFTLPEMNAGTQYIYHNLYERLSQGKDVRLSGLDMNAFDYEDITALKELYSYVFEANRHTAFELKTTLRQIAPAYKTVSYV